MLLFSICWRQEHVQEFLKVYGAVAVFVKQPDEPVDVALLHKDAHISQPAKRVVELRGQQRVGPAGVALLERLLDELGTLLSGDAAHARPNCYADIVQDLPVLLLFIFRFHGLFCVPQVRKPLVQRFAFFPAALLFQ